MQVKLRVMQGAQSGREVALSSTEFLIGRGEECHLRPKSDAISRQHCTIRTADNQCFVVDMGSKNGTYVNGQRVEGECQIQAGDHLQVGPLQFQVVFAHALGGAKRPAARNVKEVATRTAEGGSDDLDIARWLDDGADPAESQAVATPETRQFRLDDTNQEAMETQVDLGDDVPTSTDARPDSSETESEEPADESEQSGSRLKKKDPPGKLPPKSRINSRDSREAAADMLKNFFNRR